MKNVVGHRTLSVHKEHELLLKLEAAGLNDKLAQRIIDSKDNEMAKTIIRLAHKGFLPSKEQERAREIMGSNLFGIEEAIEYFEIKPSDEDLAHLSHVPYHQKTLEGLKDTHILVAIFPLSFVQMHKNARFNLLFRDQSWYRTAAFARIYEPVARWYLIRKTEMPNSCSKSLDEQHALLGRNNYLPWAHPLAYAVIGHHLATGECLFSQLCVRTSSYAGKCVTIGSFVPDLGLEISTCDDTTKDELIGIASARKHDTPQKADTTY